MEQIQISMEDDYTITKSINDVHVLVENMSFPHSCSINLYKEDPVLATLYKNEEWESFIVTLIDFGLMA